MIKVTELMINDWVSINDSNYLVKDIKKKGVIKLYENTQWGESEIEFNTDYLEEFIQPIPLTPEILENNGIKLSSTYTHPYRDGEWEEGELEEAKKRYPMYVYQTLDPHITFVIRPNEQELKVRSSNYKTIVEKKEEVIYVHELQHALKLCKIEKEIVL